MDKLTGFMCTTVCVHQSHQNPPNLALRVSVFDCDERMSCLKLRYHAEAALADMCGLSVRGQTVCGGFLRFNAAFP